MQGHTTEVPKSGTFSQNPLFRVGVPGIPNSETNLKPQNSGPKQIISPQMKLI